ncbi:MAG TPA: glycosyltransferase family 1 protein [Desulfocapsa sulfexigens]|nr:glycosyltransferase family 1 protein [Desulfocapsa sulfexigens]
MRICFYAPFKPLGHPNPSGDLIIATGLYDFLISRGHKVLIASKLRSRWIFLKPWLFPQIIKERISAASRISKFSPDLWLTYHCYYKAPDLLGPALCKTFNLPYYIFQGIYSTKQRRSLKGKLGFYLNRHGLLAADQLFSNRKVDLENLARIVPTDRLNYIKPGIFPEQFCFDLNARKKIREEWTAGSTPVILSAAMFRPDVKTRGLLWLMDALSRLAADNIPFKLVIAGDGSERETLVKSAEELLPGRVIFAGRINREAMYRFYSGGDLFAFPGIRESLGMVFLESQSCGLPVIAFDNGGIPEVVQQEITGLLTEPFSKNAFCSAVMQLLKNTKQRKTMGKSAAEHVRSNHDLHSNYLQFEKILLSHAEIS